MSKRKYAVATMAAVSGCLLVAAQAPIAGAVAAASGVSGDVSITNTETVDAKLTADGKVSSQRIYDQLVLKGDGSVEVDNPVADGARNLNGFGGLSIRDGKQRIATKVNGEKAYRTVADYDGELPVDVRVEYRLDGEKVEPKEIVGKSGTLEVTYHVRNMTGKQQDVTYVDGEGKTKKSTMAVVVPLVGSMSTVLPANFTNVQSEQANAGGDGKGGTLLSFTMTLFPPIGSDRTTFGYTAEIEDGLVPEASMSVLPVNPLKSPSFAGGAASYKGGADSGVELTEGAATIDQNLLKIRDGAEELVAGILQLDAGAGELKSGTGELAAGAKKLSGGAGELNAGAQKLNAGAGTLNSGAAELNAGAHKLNAGAGELAGGANQLAAGLGDAQAKAPALLDGVAQLGAGLAKLQAGMDTVEASIRASGEKAKGEMGAGISGFSNTDVRPILANAQVPLRELLAAASAPDASPELKATATQLTAALTAVGVADATLHQGIPQVVGKVQAGVDQLTNGIIAQGLGSATTEGTLRNGVAQLQAGVGELQAGGNDLLTGLGQLKAGADKLNGGAGQLAAGAGDLSGGTSRLAAGTGELAAGSGQLAAGTGELAPGAQELAAGAGKLDAGAGQLADGLGQAAGSAPQLPEGAQQLSDQGTSQLKNVGNATAMDYGQKYALIEAGAERAAELQPYGSPEGAVSRAAYKLTFAAEDGEDRANLLRGGAAAAIALLGLGGLAIRRKLS
ncbi:hypothetical protein EHW97_06465 [Aeromicrobium camelliae]|uniref:Uncharacterized protein n=1 Tax=Aeromicrobium camelliae TaxID=1538144 RepID=A0A3N6X4E5_9ACTN|nr:hypothetical protein [Aeromicrobium camelliae]RQN08523.1 hypothetical protein EHW97_06465 [Aeromicrobium camelliae]